jgi:short-subunit dehydrogenase
VQLTRSGPVGTQDKSDEGKGRTALVTGASSGIGRSLSELLAAKGYDLVVVARRLERLDELKKQVEDRWHVNCRSLSVDLAEPGAARLIADSVASEGTTIDFLVNNAAYGLVGNYETKSWDELERYVRVLGLAPLELTHLLLPPMLEQRWGRILNVSSLVALLPGTQGSVLYSPTKSMLYKFTEGLAAEVRSRGVLCTVSIPGATDTEIFESSGISSWRGSNPVIRRALMSPDSVAREAYQACMKGRRTVVHGLHHKALAFVMLHSPPAVRYKLTEKFLSQLTEGS